MSNFSCEYCSTEIIDSPEGYVTWCSHYPPDVVPKPDEDSVKLRQTIYKHGGSRIWIERDGEKGLVAATYGQETVAFAVMGSIRNLLCYSEEVPEAVDEHEQQEGT